MTKRTPGSGLITEQNLLTPGHPAADGLAATFAALTKVAATVTASGAGVVNKHNPVDATTAARSLSLPTGQPEGTQISVEKVDASTNAVSVTGSIRGVGSSTLPLAWQYESIMFRADSTGSWWPIAGHKTKSSIDAAITGAVAAYQLASKIADSATYGNDSTAALTHLQGLLDAAGALSTGGTVYIPRGTYRVSAPPQIPSNVRVWGEGVASIIKATFTGSSVLINKGFATTGAADITVSDLCVDGNSTANQGLTFAGVLRGTIHNVRVKRCTGYGIWLEASGENPGVSQGTYSDQCTVSDCHITDVLDTGIETASAKSSTIRGCTVEGTTGRGLYAWAGSQDITFVGNTVVGVGTNTLVAFQVAGMGDATFTSLTARINFSGNTGRNVKHGLKVAGTTGNTPTDVQFNNNTLQTTQASSNGIFLDFATRVQVHDNHIEGFVTPIRVADPVVGTSGSVIDADVDHNRIYGGGTSVWYGGTSGSLSGNRFTGLNNHGVNFFACSGLAINGNSFTNCGSANTTAMIFNDYLTVACIGNLVTSTRTVDTRGTKWLGNVVTLVGAADYNILTNNSAKGARTGGLAVQNAGTGVNNVIANNINA